MISAAVPENGASPWHAQCSCMLLSNSSDQQLFVHAQGLGKIPFSNIRRPKPLMDVGNAPAGEVTACVVFFGSCSADAHVIYYRCQAPTWQ